MLASAAANARDHAPAPGQRQGMRERRHQIEKERTPSTEPKAKQKPYVFARSHNIWVSRNLNIFKAIRFITLYNADESIVFVLCSIDRLRLARLLNK